MTADLERAAVLSCRRHLTAFALACHEPPLGAAGDETARGRRYEVGHVHRVIAWHLEAVERGEIRRLLVQCPPRIGKSTLCSRLFPAWYLGKHPDREVIGATYGDDLALDHGRAVRELLASARFRAVFPAARVNPRSDAADRVDLIAGGGYRVGGIRTGFTGKGADVCLPAGTWVETDGGPRDIEDLYMHPPSAKVLAYDGSCGLVFERIEAVTRREASGLYRVTSAAGRVVEATGDHAFYSGGRWVRADQLAPGDPLLLAVRQGVRSPGLRRPEGDTSRVSRPLLLAEMLGDASRYQEQSPLLGVRRSLAEGALDQGSAVLQNASAPSATPPAQVPTKACHLPDVQRAVHGAAFGAAGVCTGLRESLRQGSAFPSDGGTGQSEMETWGNPAPGGPSFGASISDHQTLDPGARLEPLCRLSDGDAFAVRAIGSAPHRQLADEQRGVESRDAVLGAPSAVARGEGFVAVEDTVALVERLHGPAVVFDLQVANSHNFFAAGLCVHNCVVDDPFRDMQDADSPTVRAHAKLWWSTVLMRRLSPHGGVVLVSPRWNADDLAGWVVDQSPPGTWHVLDLQAVHEDSVPCCDRGEWRKEGEAIWPGRWGAEELARVEAELEREHGPRVWRGLYQQRPTMRTGNIFQQDWLAHTYQPQDLPARFDRMIQYWDCKLTGSTTEASSWVCGAVWGRAGADFYLLDLKRFRGGFVATVDAIEAACEQWREASPIYVELAAAGPAAIEVLSQRRKDVIAHKPQGSKVQRAEAVSPFFRTGNVLLPATASWLGDYREELIAFPRGRHDDQVDVTSGGLMILRGARRELRAVPPAMEGVGWTER